ncbi:hypothetical protein GH714_001402 [Hevea brasiliensis]|uniref:Uncharacterized protein n=1 Tax=Hevea brasiliensis TaxID=3981 RepID=A0A6A6KGP5_HEVBR|nr:hypothetical protein GH714_001402 [Hevea brasiliensis]
MGCLFACFNASKCRKRRHLVNAAPSKPFEAQQIYFTTKQQVTEEPIKPATESKEKLEKELSCNGKRKVTFDLNAKTYKGLSVGEATDNVVENNEKKESENKDEEPSDESKSIPNLISSDGASYPPNHRYQNYTKEESEDLDLEDSDFDDVRDNVGVDGKILVQEESSESLFSLSIDSRKYVCGAEVGEKEVSSPMPECNSPQRNLSQLGVIQIFGIGLDSGSSSKGMLNTISKSGEDERVKWNSTPFEARLERALDKVSAQVSKGLNSVLQFRISVLLGAVLC